MKRAFKPAALLGLTLLLAAFLGCKGRVPTSTAYQGGGIGSSAYTRIDQFDLGSAAVNPTLLNAAGGGGSFAVSMLNPAVTPVIPAFVATGGVGALGTQGAAHVTGALVDTGNANALTTWQLTATLNPGSGKYDATPFRGVRYYFKTGPADTATSRTFTAMLTTTSNGTDFSMPIQGVGASWSEVDTQFDRMTRPGWAYGGSPLTPPTLSGANLVNMTALQWSEGRGGAYGSAQADFWVDEVFFY